MFIPLLVCLVPPSKYTDKLLKMKPKFVAKKHAIEDSLWIITFPSRILRWHLQPQYSVKCSKTLLSGRYSGSDSVLHSQFRCLKEHHPLTRSRIIQRNSKRHGVQFANMTLKSWWIKLRHNLVQENCIFLYINSNEKIYAMNICLFFFLIFIWPLCLRYSVKTSTNTFY